MNPQSDTQEIDIIQLTSILYKYKHIVAMIMAGFILVGIVLMFVLTPLYTTRVTFFLPNSGGASSSFLLAQYSALLKDSSFDKGKLYTIIESKRIRKNIESSMVTFIKEKNEKLESVESFLDLKSNLILHSDKWSTYRLEYSHADPDVSYEVLNRALFEIESIGTELELSNMKELISIIDSPEKSNKPSRPNKKMILVFSIFLGGFVGSGWVFFRHILLDRLKHK